MFTNITTAQVIFIIAPVAAAHVTHQELQLLAAIHPLALMSSSLVGLTCRVSVQETTQQA